ncbi:MAG TPA: DUF6580 family putative transport protein [Terriglobales bacterium]|nr:DUF6580 family putative transport protein [Terriglobales bacterium]HUL14949.1 DUF6580 family putative transport protein [Terriglobales bacterium]
MNEDKGAVWAARTAVIIAFILVAAALRIVPHPWNFTPIGAMALFSGAMLPKRWMKFSLPLAALFAGDLFIGFHALMPVVYASFLVSVLIGIWLEKRRTAGRIAGATLLGAIQFYLATNFAVWAAMSTYPKTLAGLGACYAAGIPFFWNTLAGDAAYAGLLFGGFALAERLIPDLRAPSGALGR